jgi:hypothetical protein
MTARAFRRVQRALSSVMARLRYACLRFTSLKQYPLHPPERPNAEPPVTLGTVVYPLRPRTIRRTGEEVSLGEIKRSEATPSEPFAQRGLELVCLCRTRMATRGRAYRK